MTGFGAARVEHASGQLEVEVRTVNHRHLKVNVRLPEALAALSPRVEELVRGRLARGTVYVVARQTGVLGARNHQLDVQLLRRLHGELLAMARELGTSPPDLAQLALLPGVVRELDDPGAAADLWPELARAVEEALGALDDMRRREGEGIGRDIVETVGRIARLGDAIESRAPLAVAEQAERLRARIEHLAGEHVSAADLAREVALLADRSDVCEEVHRLRSHLLQVTEAVASGGSEPVGRKLEFLAQELLREANTMASKSHDSALVRDILGVKLEVERIREQVANVE